ncbi:MAG: hypothetical protein A2X64_07225 [Ignavibacteria bacterium GWF2_33_9]|nr:MAG: hypothetical protein A2X64_07225 [Ignavibacteria bacterium GWF2_33_9]
MKTVLKHLFKLMKIRIAIATGISATVGYFLSTNDVSLIFLGVFFSAFFLAAGAASVNEIQEWKFDALMNRTKSRPIPQSFFSPKEAALFPILFFIIGFSIIAMFMISPISLLIGLSAFILYNGFYTPLKRVTPFATIPGALIGIIPPILGWSFGSTNFLSPQLFALLIFLFVWQIPHFYFLLLIFEEDYRNAGFPVLTDKFSIIQISRISFLFIITLVFVSTMIIMTDVNFNLPIFILYIVAGGVLLFRVRKMFTMANSAKFYRNAFMQLNMYVMLVLILISINKFLI